MAFNQHEFVLKTLNESIGKQPDYQIRESALKWSEKGVLTESDLESLESLLTQKNAGAETGITERIQTMETRFDIQEGAINDLLISVIPELLGGE